MRVLRCDDDAEKVEFLDVEFEFVEFDFVEFLDVEFSYIASSSPIASFGYCENVPVRMPLSVREQG